MAIMVTELLRPHMKDPSAYLDFNKFMLEPPHVLAKRKAANLARTAQYMEAAARAEARRKSRAVQKRSKR
jgi:hypothetical protein